MSITAFGHGLETVHDGLTVFSDGRPAPVPLVATDIAVEIVAGLATVRTSRRFVNAEGRPIEAILTMPVAFDAVVTAMRAVVDGRVLVAAAKPKAEARDSYEAALDEGKLAVLHEEVLRGVHALSVGNLAAGREVTVEIETVVPLSAGVSGPFLRIPVTVGQLYGASPLAPVDDLVTSANVRHDAGLTVAVDAGQVVLAGRVVTGAQRISLDAAIEIVVQGGQFGAHHGVAADGRQVRVDLRPVAAGSGALDLAVLVDHSGSTGSRAKGPRGLTVWQAIRDGLRMELGRLRETDRIALWEFASDCDALGVETGPAAAGLVSRLKKPEGGTALDGAVSAVLRAGAQDILVLTDGQTWSATVDALAASKARISAILVGSGSLDANIGQLCAMTGGQVFYAAGDDVAASLSLAFAALRQRGGAVEGRVVAAAPERVVALRGGVEITVEWSEAMALRGADAVGRFAAALALPLLGAEAAEDFARAHGLCTHRTSLVLVDEAGEVVEGMAQQRKVPLMAARFAAGVRQEAEMPAFSASFKESSRGIRPLISRKRIVVDHDAALGLAEDVSAHIAPVIAPDDLRQMFAGLRWDALCDELLAGDVSSLDTVQRNAVLQISAVDRIARFAAAAGLPVTAVALALIADLIDDRLARRFVRQVFRGLTVADWGHLRLWDQSPSSRIRALLRR
jgi:hypothetical protein